jgi:UDP-N-acetylmuramate--alanine ligase
MTHSLGRIHIVGIGGAGMSALARLLLAQGAQVSGSDAKDSKRLDALTAEGAITYIGHSADHVAKDGVALVDTVAASTAVPESNAELAKARELGIRVLTRAQLLCAITDAYEVASVAGTHGKTTTTSMLTVILQNAGDDPSFAIGSELNETGSNAHLGSGSVFVVEADESDGTFLTLNTKAAIVTNVEPDHLN